MLTEQILEDPQHKEIIKAITLKDMDAVKSWLAKPGIDINAQDKHGWTALHYAVSFASIEITKLILNHSNTDVNTQDKAGHTVLHRVVDNGCIEIAKLLLQDSRIDLHVKDHHGQTILDFANKRSRPLNRHDPIISFFIKEGANELVHSVEKLRKNCAVIKKMIENRLNEQNQPYIPNIKIIKTHYLRTIRTNYFKTREPFTNTHDQIGKEQESKKNR